MNNQNINELIKQVTIDLNKVYSKKKIPSCIKKYLKIIIVGLFINYEDKIQDDFYDMFDDINFIIGKRNILKYISSNTLNYNIIEKVPKTILDINKENQDKITYNICIGDYYLGYKAFIFEFLISQLNKILCNKNENILVDNDSMLYHNSYMYKNSNLTFNEVINGLQVESIIKNILKLNEYDIKDKNIKDVLKYLKDINYYGYVCNEYINEITLFRRLYEDKTFRSLIDDSLLKGDIDKIKNDFDYYLGVNSYNGICDLLNQLSIEIHIMPYVNNTYDISNLYCKIRLILANYIKNKYAK